ncbi:hypothetical protein CEP51_001021 [Fusarium floridanum]|uniref:Zn(2)-C6 fungal-type domain-containing protein n=1 Tax=Fusarium floridanum TaxID=1325733 RepID=A0A428SJE5_9HYPO|nr:hypothetical protein CEP51_001021 [Fusarium floridanum]
MPGVEAMQGQAGRRRAERQTSSCTECRRRKQKCSQGQPCTNCLRRFPQPICEYKVKSSKRSSAPTSLQKPPPALALRQGPYAHLNPADVQEAIINLEDALSGSSSGSSAQNPHSKISPWVPFKIVSKETQDEDEAILKSLQVIVEHRLTLANRIYLDEGASETTKAFLAHHEGRRPVGLPVEGSMEQLRLLPMEPTNLNKELVRIHLQLLCRFKCSVDGNPDPSNAFMKYWVPCCVQDPLLLQIVLFTSSCFLSETGHIPKIIAMMHKGKVYHLLNSQLRDEASQTSDASVLGVVQMVADSWYWGATADLKAHIRGLKQMIRMRGGLSQLGLHGYLAKMIIVHDVVMALAHEIDPCIYGHPGFTFQDPILVPFKTALNTPLIFGWPTFQGCSNSLQLHPSTAQILDDMRYLFDVVLSLPEYPSATELDNVVTTAGWVQDRISDLPDDAPSRRSTPSRSSSVESPGKSPGSARSDKSSPPVELPDMMYRVVRLTSLIWVRSILNRSPTSTMCSERDVMVIWGSVWQAGLPCWQAVVGIFVWIILALVPSCHKTPAGRFMKTLMVSTFMSIGVDNWHIAMDITRTAFKLQRWLAGGRINAGEKGLSGGETVVDKYGFVMKEILPEIQLPTDDE